MVGYVWNRCGWCGGEGVGYMMGGGEVNTSEGWGARVWWACDESTPRPLAEQERPY